MNESLELLFKIRTEGNKQMEEISQAIDGIASSTKLSNTELNLFEKVLQSLVQSGASVSQALTDVSNSEKGLGKSVADAAMELLKQEQALAAETVAANTASAAVRNLGQAHRATITDVQAASAAIRGLEGNLSIRAVEQFSTKLLGLGGAFQAIFPVVGALAMAGVIERGIEKVGELYNAWSPVIQAEQNALKTVEDLDRAYAKLADQQKQQLYFDVERREGKAGLLRFQAGENQSEAQYQDQRIVDDAKAKIADIERRIREGTVSD